MIYITGDTHGELERLKSDAVKKLKKSDTLIICGDFGFVWNGSKEEQERIRKIGKLKPTVLFVPGCHDNYDLLKTYPEEEFCGGKVRRLSGNLYELLRGEIYTIEGKTVFAFGGGVSEDIQMREHGTFWWKDEIPSEREYEQAIANLSKQDNQVDYIITHDVSSSLKQFLRIETDNQEIERIHAFFNVLSKNVKFKAWYFGKYHQDKVVPPYYFGVFKNILLAAGQDTGKKKKKKTD